MFVNNFIKSEITLVEKKFFFKIILNFPVQCQYYIFSESFDEQN